MREKGVSSAVVIVIVIVVAVVGVGGYLFLKGEGEEGGLTSHEPIYINGNAGFTPANGVSSGSGTPGDPYIIEGWDIKPKIKLSHGQVGLSGIQIVGTDAYFIIRNCKVHGDRAENLFGITFYNVKNGKIEKTIIDTNFNGIRLQGQHSENNIIENCVVKNNGMGILLLMASNNVIRNCIVRNNNNGIELAPWIPTGMAGPLPMLSDNNRVYHNDFVNNENQAFDGGSNYWDNGSEGNYWSDYTGEDINNDGIGDTPYTISRDNNQDRYPLMSPFVEKQPPEPVRWLLITVIVAIIGIAFVFYMKRR